MRTRLRLIPAALVLGLLSACGGGGTSEDSVEPAVLPTATSTPDAVACPEPELVQAFNVNVQLVAQYPTVDPAEWGQGLGTMDAFASQIEALRPLEGDDVQAALDLFSRADEIVTRGFGGDPSAAADLKALLGTNPATTLQHKLPIVTAYSRQCP